MENRKPKLETGNSKFGENPIAKKGVDGFDGRKVLESNLREGNQEADNHGTD
jgi:hypothetical protein